MDIFEAIEDIAKKGYSIEYIAVDQYQNGCSKQIAKGLIPSISYTVYVVRLSDAENVYTESFDHIIECLQAGIKFMKSFNLSIIK